MNKKKSKVDLNNADIDELTSLPGVGFAMAERIVAARPFTSKNDLRRVEGIGAVVYERLSTLVSVSPPKKVLQPEELPPQEEESSETAVTALVEAGEAELASEDLPETIPLEVGEQLEEAVIETPAEEPQEEQVRMVEVLHEEPLDPPDDVSEQEEAAEEIEPEAEETGEFEPEVEEPVEIPHIEEQPAAPAALPPDRTEPPAGIRRTEVYGVAIFSGCLSILLAVLIGLGLLSMLNGGLRFASQLEVQNLRRQIGGMENQVLRLRNEMENLQTRVDNLEGLGGRISALEKENNEFRRQMEAISKQVDQINVQVDALASQMREISARTDRFQSFLEGLRNLLDGLSTQP